MLTKDEREQIAAQVRAAKDPSRPWCYWSVEYATAVPVLLADLDLLEKRIEELGKALTDMAGKCSGCGGKGETSYIASHDHMHDIQLGREPCSLCRAAREALKEACR